MAYSKLTELAIAEAKNKEPDKRTRHDRIILMLANSPTSWVGGLELSLKAGGLGYRSRITELRHKGIPIVCRRDPNTPRGESWYLYRLEPEGEVVSI